jgi:chromosome segregation ATPase
MADPISITSLILDVSTIVSQLITYAKAVKGASDDIRRLSEEMFALKGILEHLRAQVELKSTELPELETITFNPEQLRSAIQTTNEFLRKLLADLEEPKGRLKRLKGKLEWPFTQDQFNIHLTRLERVKSWLILVLTTDNSALSRDMYHEINNLARSLRDDLRIRERETIQMANKDLFEWLAPVSPENDHLRASKNREIGTGNFFVDGYLKNWLNANDDLKILFLRGKCRSMPLLPRKRQLIPNVIAGIGKTTLL